MTLPKKYNPKGFISITGTLIRCIKRDLGDNDKQHISRNRMMFCTDKKKNWNWRLIHWSYRIYIFAYIVPIAGHRLLWNVIVIDVAGQMLCNHNHPVVSNWLPLLLSLVYFHTACALATFSNSWCCLCVHVRKAYITITVLKFMLWKDKKKKIGTDQNI